MKAPAGEIAAGAVPSFAKLIVLSLHLVKRFFPPPAKIFSPRQFRGRSASPERKPLALRRPPEHLHRQFQEVLRRAEQNLAVLLRFDASGEFHKVFGALQKSLRFFRVHSPDSSSCVRKRTERSAGHTPDGIYFVSLPELSRIRSNCSRGAAKRLPCLASCVNP